MIVDDGHGPAEGPGGGHGGGHGPGHGLVSLLGMAWCPLNPPTIPCRSTYWIKNEAEAEAEAISKEYCSFFCTNSLL